jgi:hypothetical protein
MKFQIPSTNSQTMIKIPKKESLDVWNLVIGHYLELGIW